MALDDYTLADLRQELVRRGATDQSVTLDGGASIRLDRGEASGEGRRLARYGEVVEIGRGGMGVILRGTDPDLGRQVALKMLLGAEDRSARDLRKFCIEAQVTGQLEHPGIVPVHELGMTDEQQPYFSMKLVKGRSLGEILEGLRTGDPDCVARYTRPRLLAIFVKVCDAIDFAHDKGVIHRDLKPDNVMVGEFGEVLVMDWGLARVEGTEDGQSAGVTLAPPAEGEPLRTLDGQIMGTPAYMPPEQADGKISAIGPRSDVYSLGAILYELLTHSPPYEGRSVWAVLDAVTEGALEPPSQRAPEARIPRELEAVVLKAMARRSRARYLSVQLLRADIEAYLDGRALAAADYSPIQRLAKWVARHKAASVAALCVVLSVAGLLGARKLEARREQARRETELLGRLAELRAAVKAARQTCAAHGAIALKEETGEFDEEAARRWFDGRASLLESLEHLASFGGRAESPRVRAAVDVARVDGARVAVCREAWKQATAIRQYPLARMWVGRTVGAGATRAQRDEALAWIESERRRAIEVKLDEARARLDEALEKSALWKPDDWRARSVDYLLRRSSPDLVRLLLEPKYFASENETQRLLVIETLGRLKDRQTRDAEGRTVSERLTRALVALEHRGDAEMIKCLGRALKRLDDPSIKPLLVERLQRESPDSDYATQVRRLIGRLPLPPEFADGGARAPKTAAAFYERAQVHARGGRVEAALADYRRAVEREPANREYQFQLGVAASRLQKYDEALAALDAAVRLAPDDPKVLYERGFVRRELGQRERALADLGRVVQLDKRHARAHVQIGWVYLDLGKGQDALASFNAAIAIDPGLSDAYWQRGRLFRRYRQFSRAIQDYNVAISLRPSYASYGHLYRGMAYAALGKLDRALADFNRCLRISGSHPSAYLQRGQLFERLGQVERAIRDYRSATGLSKTFWPAHFACGLALARLERAPEARTALRAALAHAPKAQQAQIRAALARLGD